MWGWPWMELEVRHVRRHPSTTKVHLRLLWAQHAFDSRVRKTGSDFVRHRSAVSSFTSLATRFCQGNEVCPPLQIREISERKNGEKTHWDEWARVQCSFNMVVTAVVHYTRLARVARGRNLSISTMGFLLFHIFAQSTTFLLKTFIYLTVTLFGESYLVARIYLTHCASSKHINYT